MRAAFTGALLFLCLAGTLTAQVTPRELRQSGLGKMNRGEFMDAIPDLMQLIQMLGETEDKSLLRSLEPIYFGLGICNFFVGQFGAAEQALETYLKKYRHGSKRAEAAVYIADSVRFRGNFEKARSLYRDALLQYDYTPSMKADIYASIARCYLGEGNWGEATDPLLEVYRRAPDYLRQGWAAALLATSYFKQLELDKIYPITSYILRPNSFASRSIAFSMAALEAGDDLFGEERYRDALWVFRMVYPYETVRTNTERYLAHLRRQAERMKNSGVHPRQLMRIQENIGELEEELKVLGEIDDYTEETHSRIARGYMEMMRYREARQLFLYLFEEADEPLAEESLFLAFQCSTRLLPWTRAFELGESYMEEYPSGEYFDMLTLTMGQMYAKQQDWPKVIEHLVKSLEMSPDHESGAECMFLIGYASFMEEKFADTVRWLRKLLAKYPASELVADAIYWTAMAFLFQSDYESAAVEFDRLLASHRSSRYIEDATFRRAVCAYGIGDYEDSDQRLAAFVSAYPESALLGEAVMMRGDIAGAQGRLDDAVAAYRRAMKYEDLNIELYNHCTFQSARILADEEDYGLLREHLREYIEANREGANIPLAVYWVGVAMWNSGEAADALRYYREAVVKYGRDPKAVGIDMILDEWVGRIKRSSPEAARQAWEGMRRSLDQATQANQKTMMLRLQRVVLLDAELPSSRRQRIEAGLLSEQDLSAASPAVLQLMLDMAREKGKQDYAVRVARHIIEAFTETDYALDARMVLAEFAIEEAREIQVQRLAEERYAEAIRHLEVVREVFATSGEAARALMLLGQLYTQRKDFEKADECYKAVLGVKGWRNFWPQALYGRGECALQQGRFDEASAYYERIYLMYSHYRQWAAKAYLRRAEALRDSARQNKAMEVLREMLGRPELADLPETEKARVLLGRMGGV